MQTSRGAIRSDRVGCVASGHSTTLAKMAGFRMPLESHPLQAFVSESLKPIVECVPSQSGLFFDPPQRQSAAASTFVQVLPSAVCK